MSLRFSTKFLLFDVFVAAVALAIWRVFLPDGDSRALPLLIIAAAVIPLLCCLFGPRGMYVGVALAVITYVGAVIAMLVVAVVTLVQYFS